ncbi:MAG: hypothetical protein H6618_03375 [Deltaproteobacteria bacterium]|nr:hypothetical protein [Deltaproteobacteria bacterium]
MIRVSFSFEDVRQFLKETEKDIRKATRTSMNEAISAAHREGARIMERERHMKLKGNKGRSYKKLSKKKHYNLRTGFASILGSEKSVSLIHLTEGRRRPEKQKGKALRDRRRLRISIRQGRTLTDQKSFIAKANAKSGEKSYLVFRRLDNKDGKNIMVKQAAPGVHKTLIKEEYQSDMMEKAEYSLFKSFIETFGREYEKSLKRYSDKMS